jgi:hypothetical protein
MNLIRYKNTKIVNLSNIFLTKKLLVNFNVEFAMTLAGKFGIRLDEYLNLEHYTI